MRKLLQKIKGSKWRSTKVGLIVLAVLSTCWFLFRVIPKPSRATYPCMQATAPFMSALVIYLISIFGGGATLIKLKQNWVNRRYLAIAGFLVLGLGAYLLFSMQNSKLGFSQTNDMQLSDPVNSPFGTPVGYYPGRVVWVFDADATNEYMTNTRNDYWYQNTDIEIVEKMLADGLMKYSEAKTSKEAWDRIFRNFNIRHDKGKIGYKAGEKIVIKINTTNTSSTQYNYYERMDATPEVVYAVLKQLIEEVGVNQKDITVGDPYRCFANPIWDLCKPAFPNVHYFDAYGESGREQTKVSVTQPLVFSDKKFKSRLPQAYLEASYMINLPCLKSHGSAGITITAKNHQGSILGSTQTASSQSANFHHYSYPDVDHNTRNKYRHLVDYMGHAKLGGNTLLYIVDAIWSGTDWNGGVEKWGMKPFNFDYTSSLLISQDQVAIESVGYDFLFAEYTANKHYNAFNDESDFPLWPAAQDYIHQAASSDSWPTNIKYDPEGDGTPIASLGVHEHWNDVTNKQYTVNLTGVNGGIHLVSVPTNLVKSLPVNYDPVPLHFNATEIDLLADLTIKVYPNPFKDNLFVELPATIQGRVTVEIYDASVKRVFAKQFNQVSKISINDIAHLQKGFYYIKIIAGSKTYSTSVSK